MNEALESTKKLCTLWLNISKVRRKGEIYDFECAPMLATFMVDMTILKLLVLLVRVWEKYPRISRRSDFAGEDWKDFGISYLYYWILQRSYNEILVVVFFECSITLYSNEFPKEVECLVFLVGERDMDFYVEVGHFFVCIEAKFYLIICMEVAIILVFCVVLELFFHVEVVSFTIYLGVSNCLNMDLPSIGWAVSGAILLLWRL